METVTFSWETVDRWPRMYINGERYRGLISSSVYYRTVCRSIRGEIRISREELLSDD